MSNSHPQKHRPAPFSIRLTENERAALQSRAGGLPLGFYVKQVLFADSAPAMRLPRALRVEQSLLGRVLAQLGASRTASNLNQLAKAANQGSLPVTAETETDLRRACADIAAMRAALMQALGVHAADRDSRSTPTEIPGAGAMPEART
jgi:hypothetical protein